jgi:antitoxin VapB
MEGPSDIDSLEFRTRLLVRRLTELTGESAHEAVHRAVAERVERLSGPATPAERRQRVINMLESSVWRHAPSDQIGRGLSRKEEDSILGYGPEGV